MSLGTPLSIDASPDSAGFSDVALHFAQAWAEVAPGRGGWTVTAGAMDDRSVITVASPGCEEPVFFVSLVDGVVVVERQRAAQAGGAFILEGRFRTLEDALLDLCPLSEEQLERLEARLVERLKARMSGQRRDEPAMVSHAIH